MTAPVQPLIPLADEQAVAADPTRLVWLSASAGTGKTHVLTARVLRLLLSGVRPDAILCLTFTKAGAAEMADRIHARLAYWVRLPDPQLGGELIALGESPDPARRAFARTLFARVLDAPGGGLRIQTIHAFCQSLLAGFPAEAGLVPGFRPLEGREEAQLARETLATLLVNAERGGDLPLIRDVQSLSRRLGESSAESFLLACARAPDAMAALGPGIEAKLRRAMDVPDGDIEAHLADQCAAFDHQSLSQIAAANARWATKGGLSRADSIAAWTALDATARAAALDDLHLVWAKADGDIRSFGKGQAPQEPDYADAATRLHGACAALLALRTKAAFAASLAAGLRAGQAYARAYVEAKRAIGGLDFDDLIRATVALLETPGMGDWVRYKLDRATNHILVDEAQDTNAAQWSIVAALAGEFFAGEGARGGGEPDWQGRRAINRTIFTVGDFKQAIFGFQGTDPMAFEAARRSFAARAGEVNRSFDALSLDRSFRSTPPVLEVVDRLLADLGSDALGLFDDLTAHRSAKTGKPGTVLLLRPVAVDDSGEEGEEGWIDDATRKLADRLAKQVRDWLDQPLHLHAKGRPLKPEDVLILVRKRGSLASLLVARLHAEGVPVAGVDRLRLDAPLAVRDLLAAIRFALQPADDLNLAALLVSPLFGLSQDDLFRAAHDRGGRALWDALRDRATAPAAIAGLDDLLRLADLVTPYRFLETILSGPLDGRRRLLRRLGAEASDPIDELLAAALDFETRGIASLQLFIDWFDRGEVEIKRDPSAPIDAVRVMTVHGAKGLQAPLVILADATVDPDNSPARSLKWDGAPILRPKKEERHPPFAEILTVEEDRERAEHWRLLYVAATRAEERLIVAGALTPKMRGQAPAASWYAAIEKAMTGLGAAAEDDPDWGGLLRHEHAATGPATTRSPREKRVLPVTPPAWLHAPAPVEQRPPRPLAPSAIGRDLVADPPPNPAMRAAAERGRLLHALFERLPPLAPADRAVAADRWLAGSGGVSDAAARAALVADACTILADPRFAGVFAADALAEVPIAAVVDGQVVAGTVDRLLVSDDRILVVDFKTGRRVPRDLAAAPDHHLDQIGAYAAALAAIFPGRPVEAALLYTAGPLLLPVDPATLASRKPRFTAPDQSFVVGS